MRRTDRQITEEEAMHLLIKGEYGVLSTSTKDGIPYGVPLNYCVQDHDIYFHCALQGRKTDHVQENPRVSFCVTGHVERLPEKFSTRYESVIVSGNVEEVNGDKKQQALEAFLRKYASAYLEQGHDYIKKMSRKTRVFRLHIETLSGKAHR